MKDERPYTDRERRLIEINTQPCLTIAEAQERYGGMVWETNELSREFVVTGFLAPYVGVKRISDGMTGSLEFQHSPRFYFSWLPDSK